MAPRVSVVVPNYNHARFLPRRLESILSQSYQDFEIILLDDASSDESLEVLQRYAGDPRVRSVWNESNSGSPFKQWNKGARLARGEYLWIAESDDYADPRFLELLVEVMERNPRVGLAYSQSYRIDEDDNVLGSNQEYTAGLGPRWQESFVSSGAEECCRYLLYMNTIPNASAVLLRRSVLEAAGYAPETMRLSGDHDLWVRMLLLSDLAFVADHLNYFRHHLGSVRQDTYRNGVYLDEGYDVRARILSRLSPPADIVEWVHNDMVDRWVQLVLLRQGEIPLARNLSIYRKARRLDRRLLRRVLVRAVRQQLAGTKLAQAASAIAARLRRVL